MWGDLAEIGTYVSYSIGPVWINEISCYYAFGEGTVHLEAPSTDPSRPWIPIMIFHKVFYAPDLHRGSHGPIRLFS